MDLNLEKDFSYLELDTSLTNYTKYTISMSLRQIQFEDEKDRLIVEDMLRQEAIQCINKSIYHSFDKNNFKFLDIRNYQEHDFHRKIYEFIMISNSIFKYTNLITNSKLGSYIQDSSSFFFTQMNSTSNPLANRTFGTYLIGKLHSINSFVDPYMKFSDNEIHLFNNIKINYYTEDIVYTAQSTFAPKATINVFCDFKVEGELGLWVVDDEASAVKYISINRDIKIDKLLGE